MKKFILLLLLIFVISLNSCGTKNEVSVEKKGEQKREMNNEKVETKNDELTKKEEAETKQATEDENKRNELGITPGLPNNFPSDVPQPKNSKTLGSLNSTDGTVVTFESSDKVADIVSYYKEEMKKNGYTITEDGEAIVSDKGGLINWKKDSKEVGLMLGYDKDKNITSLVITYK